MLFSVITVTFNAEAVIEPTLRSIAAQTFEDYEHIVVDGASSDGTLEKVRSMHNQRTRIVSEPDEGVYDAMNHGLDLARGEYVIFMNAGDSFPSADTLQRYADAIAANSKDGLPGIVYGQTLIVNAARQPLGPRHLTAPRELTLQSFADGMVVCHQAMAVLRCIVGRFDWRRYRLSADYEWAIRCLQRSRKNVYVDGYVAEYLREGLSTRNRRRSLAERYRIMCRYYGAGSTLLRHFKFLFRALRRGALS